MRNLKQLDEHLHNQEGGNSSYYMGYKEAIEGIRKDIGNHTSIKEVILYLDNLLDLGK